MRPVKKILCAVDLLDHGVQVAKAAIATAKAFDAELVILNVAVGMPTGSMSYELEPTHIAAVDAESRAAAEKSMHGFMEQHFKGIQATSMIEVGSPAERILACAEESGADMIVMGTMGRKGLPLLIFGSVAEEVVKSSPVPVLTLRPVE